MTMPHAPQALPELPVNEALESVTAMVNFAYEQGFHELGYDPLQVIRASLAAPPASVRGLVEFANSFRISVVDNFYKDAYLHINFPKSAEHPHGKSCTYRLPTPSSMSPDLAEIERMRLSALAPADAGGEGEFGCDRADCPCGMKISDCRHKFIKRAKDADSNLLLAVLEDYREHRVGEQGSFTITVIESLIDAIGDATTSMQPPTPRGDGAAAVCKWHQQDDGFDWFSTGCGHEYIVNDCTDGNVQLPFCPFCARRVQGIAWTESDDVTLQEALSNPAPDAADVGVEERGPDAVAWIVYDSKHIRFTIFNKDLAAAIDDRGLLVLPVFGNYEWFDAKAGVWKPIDRLPHTWERELGIRWRASLRQSHAADVGCGSRGNEYVADPAQDHPHWYDVRALEIARKFIPEADQWSQRAALQVAIIAEMKAAVPAPGVDGGDTPYRDAFFQIANALDICAKTYSPKEALERDIMPKIRALMNAREMHQ